jgi:hypothetical protein
VEAKFAMAMHNPRDWMVARQRILDACDRPGFAKAAVYSKPVGGAPIKGLSIRFAEEAARSMGNILVEAPVVFDDDDKQLVRVNVTDLETNTTYTEDVIVTKTIERKKLKDGQIALGTRTNSFGDLVYIIEATDDDLMVKRNALKSKAMRNCILRVLPSDIAEEARARCEETAKDSAAKDPEAERKWIADAFRSLGITVDLLTDYLGVPLSQATPDQLVELRQVGEAINAQETTWSAVIAAKKAGPIEDTGAKAPDPAKEALKTKLAEKTTKAPPVTQSGPSKPLAALFASLEHVGQGDVEGVDRWFEANIVAIEALTAYDRKALEAASKKKAG